MSLFVEWRRRYERALLSLGHLRRIQSKTTSFLRLGREEIRPGEHFFPLVRAHRCALDDRGTWELPFPPTPSHSEGATPPKSLSNGRWKRYERAMPVQGGSAAFEEIHPGEYFLRR